MTSEPAEPTTRQDDQPPMPFDLWWSPSMKRLLTRHEDMDDEHLVWVVQSGHESLRHYLGTGLDSNPPLPDDAVRLVLADPAQTTELAEAQRSAQFWQGQAENWEREHRNTVLPYTTKLETERGALQARADAALAEIANWWGTGKPGTRTLMAVNSILRGHVDAALVEQPPVQPLHWRTEDGGIAAVMCSACHTLGGHDDDCPRRTGATS